MDPYITYSNDQDIVFNNDKDEVVVVIDPLEMYYPQEIAKRGKKMICLVHDIDRFKKHISNDDLKYHEVIVHKDFETTIKALAKYNVKNVVIAHGMAPELGNKLLKHYGLPYSSTEQHIFHKYHMQERLRERRVRCIDQIYSSDINKILNWHSQHKKWPVVVKPALSDGSEGVFICKNKEELVDTITKWCKDGHVGTKGIHEADCLVQEFLHGEEYCVDFVSHKGKHVLVSIMKYLKLKDPQNPDVENLKYLDSELIDSKSEEANAIIRYVREVLDALDINEGCSHTEIMLSPEGKPCLIETDNRHVGSIAPTVQYEGTGLNSAQLHLDVLLNNAQYFEKLGEDYRYPRNKRVCVSFLNNQKSTDGVLLEPFEHKFRQIPSVQYVRPIVKPGQVLKRTKDLHTLPGCCIISNSEPDQYEKDKNLLRNMELNDLYKVR